MEVAEGLFQMFRIPAMTFVYLHGFKSAFYGESDKVKLLEKAGNILPVSYDSFDTYENIMADLVDKLKEVDELVLVGTSLGGFYAAHLAKYFGVPSIIINPAMDPMTTLAEYVGEELVNHVTGEIKTLSPESLASYGGQGLALKYPYNPLLLLDLGDEVIDARKTLETLSTFPVAYWDGGNHRFTHMVEAMGEIEKYLNRHETTGHL